MSRRKISTPINTLLKRRVFQVILLIIGGLIYSTRDGVATWARAPYDNPHY